MFSGLKLNRSKTEGFLLGRLKNKQPNVQNISFSHKPIKTLGVYFGYDREECDRLNWATKNELCKQLINIWKARNLIYFGKLLLLSPSFYLN